MAFMTTPRSRLFLATTRPRSGVQAGPAAQGQHKTAQPLRTASLKGRKPVGCVERSRNAPLVGSQKNYRLGLLSEPQGVDPGRKFERGNST